MALGPMVPHAEFRDGLGSLAFARTGGRLLFHLVCRP